MMHTILGWAAFFIIGGAAVAALVWIVALVFLKNMMK